jgi:hypothetical protein
MAAASEIRWSRVLLGGLFIELMMLAIVVPVNSVSERTAYYLVPILAPTTAFIFGKWAAKPLHSHFVLHGVLVAVVASVIYITLTTAAGVPVPLLYHLSHGLRLLGGAAGGAYAGKHTTPMPGVGGV